MYLTLKVNCGLHEEDDSRRGAVFQDGACYSY